MDELEKRIIEKYGTEKISPEEIDRILNDAAREGLIERKDIRPQPPMDASSLIDHISYLRRLFLINDGFHLNSDEDPYESLCCSGEKTDNSQILNNVLKAYFEYEKMCATKKKPTRKAPAILAVMSIFLFLFFSYTPKPY
ncbi:uncharacterized protein VICG_01704 [Vittaforma corneae ATCC 50505]|uniref:Uncharacterized protein n=1 Tax=Vittaforma corneae (strain ATCC 50505) TaxID=993615 RepID=L2GL44_VITCO|nr:uncharacterized protein VICG_01704 [Vittaforma corneae ATCC 50505]ELA41215.1 hypothetical protein VICG_01704 [Vittaforma corneae ATCC 50505]